MPKQISEKTAYRVAELPQNTATPFNIIPDSDALKPIADALKLVGLRKLRFEGTIAGFGSNDWRVSGVLGATVIQSCVVSLDPVTTRLDVPVDRVFTQELNDSDEEEYELSEDDATDPLGETIDLADILLEELGLALPLYPRAETADSVETVFAEPGVKPMRDEDARPFAGLAALRDQLSQKDEK